MATTAVISKPTKILFVIAIMCIGIALSWQHYSQSMHEQFDGSPILYDLDTRTGELHASRDDHAPRLARVLRVGGMFALLLALPLLVGDITHWRQRRLDN